jgi:hypothetical protein
VAVVIENPDRIHTETVLPVVVLVVVPPLSDIVVLSVEVDRIELADVGEKRFNVAVGACSTSPHLRDILGLMHPHRDYPT